MQHRSYDTVSMTCTEEAQQWRETVVATHVTNTQNKIAV